MPPVLDAVCKQWKEFDLEGKRNELDGQASEITETREVSLLSRKKLAAQTREFKKNSLEEKQKAIGPLLKTYQQEIDHLTKRCKGSEGAFLSIYASLQHLTDPCICLEAAMKYQQGAQSSSVIGELKLENQNLKTRLEEFQTEFKDIKNQEVTIRRLEDKVKEFKEKMDDKVQNQVQVTAEAIREEHITTITQLKEREENLAHQLQQTKRELNRYLEQKESEQDQRITEKRYYEEKLEVKQDELEYVAEEINRVTAENERLKRDLGKQKQDLEASTLPSPTTKTAPHIDNLKLQITQKERDLKLAEEKISEIQHKMEIEEEKQRNVITDLEGSIIAQQVKIEGLEAEIERRPTVERFTKLKEKLKVLKGVEGITSFDDISSKDSAESLLQQKNKRLETLIIQQRDSLTLKESEIEKLYVRVKALNEEVEQQKLLVEKLEQNLLQGYSSASLNEDNNNVNSSTPRMDSMIKIVCTQRDRMQDQLQRVEEGKERDQKQILSLNSELASLRGDNVKLYQKIQYLENYNTKRKPRDLESGVEVKYKEMYEESVNPFVNFNRKERYSRYNQLSAAEKVTLTMGDFFLSNKFSRLFILLYTLCLHVFIFVLMYKFAQVPSFCPVEE